MADSSTTTGCLVWTKAQPAEILAEARFAERRGWVVTIEEWYARTEDEAHAPDIKRQRAYELIRVLTVRRRARG